MTNRTPANSSTRSLRRRLFQSHLLVLAVALVVLLLGVGAVALLFELLDLQDSLGSERGSGPFGLLFGLVAAVVAAGLVSWRVTHRISDPLEEIGAATRQFANGQYTARVPEADIEELDRLANDVNQLAHTLDTTERRRLRLIGDVSHELRNPLSTIEGTMEAILDGVVQADDATISRVAREAARLRRLADDLSALSSAGELGIANHESLDVAALAEGVAAQLEPQASVKGLELRLYKEGAQLVRGDSDRLTQVLTNIVGNALQYTDEGWVEVRVFAEDLWVVIEVQDNGRGLASEELERVFERFHRVDGDFSDGTGVGLAIARLLVRGHGGTVSAASAGLGSGSTFRIELPAI